MDGWLQPERASVFPGPGPVPAFLMGGGHTRGLALQTSSRVVPVLLIGPHLTGTELGVVGAGSVARGGHSPGGPGCLGIADPEGLSQGEDVIQRC